ncbi:MAG: DUF6769 family protein [Draconibacterium sp.]
MKRNLAAIFILLANMVLFAHAVVPHHHHDSNLCFEAKAAGHNANDECCGEGCKTSDESHQHNSDEASDDCLLSNVIALFNGDVKQNIRTQISFLNLIYNTSLFVLEGNENLRVSNPHFFIEIVFNDQIPIYHSLASRAFGLRAPPFSC